MAVFRMYENLDAQARLAVERDLVKIFQRAIPEITDKAEIFYTDENPYRSHDGETISLQEYEIPAGAGKFFYRFTIARWVVTDTFPEKEFIVVKPYHITFPGFDSGDAPTMLVCYSECEPKTKPDAVTKQKGYNTL